MWKLELYAPYRLILTLVVMVGCAAFDYWAFAGGTLLGASLWSFGFRS